MVVAGDVLADDVLLCEPHADIVKTNGTAQIRRPQTGGGSHPDTLGLRRGGRPTDRFHRFVEFRRMSSRGIRNQGATDKVWAESLEPKD